MKIRDPQLYKIFCRVAKQVAKTHDRFSARAIFHHIRWEVEVEGKHRGRTVNNNLSSTYARQFMKDFPKYEGLFELRQRRKK